MCPNNVLILGDLDEFAILECVICIFVNDGTIETACVCAEDVCPDRKCLSSLRVSVMKFVGFDDEGEIGNVVILDYHIDEMGFRLRVQLSLSPWASDHLWCIVIVVNDGRATRMYCRNKVRWCIIIVMMTHPV